MCFIEKNHQKVLFTKVNSTYLIIRGVISIELRVQKAFSSEMGMHDVFINGGYGYDYPGGSGTWGNAPHQQLHLAPSLTPPLPMHSVPSALSQQRKVTGAPPGRRWGVDVGPLPLQPIQCLGSRFPACGFPTLGGIVFLTKASLPPSQGSEVLVMGMWFWLQQMCSLGVFSSVLTIQKHMYQFGLLMFVAIIRISDKIW